MAYTIDEDGATTKYISDRQEAKRPKENGRSKSKSNSKKSQ